jgi:hypothetical protein
MIIGRGDLRDVADEDINDSRSLTWRVFYVFNQIFINKEISVKI